ncbi:Branched-chain amino acid transport system carrier protein [Bacillus cereus]|nr:Branched-chain amino acid transport system carrier protein [Bacillus cereus]
MQMKSMKGRLRPGDTVAIGLMLFALFLGAGNLIFPPVLGQQAGENVWVATIGNGSRITPISCNSCRVCRGGLESAIF